MGEGCSEGFEYRRAEITSAATCLFVKQGINDSSYLLLPDLDYSSVLYAGIKGGKRVTVNLW